MAAKVGPKIYCQVRQEWVVDQPEERVRQSLIDHMIKNLGYPIGMIAVEKALSQVPHLVSSQKKGVPERRADIICFARGIHPDYGLYPLLLVECKAVPITQQVLQQVMGYNYYLRSYFVCVANREEVRTGWLDSETQQYQFSYTLPSYRELLDSVGNA